MVVCQFYLKGDCRFGDKCRNEHPNKNPSRTVCQYFSQGNCRYGANCRFEHPTRVSGGFGAHQSPFHQSGFSSRQSYGSSAKQISFKSNFTRDQNPFGVLAQQPTHQPFSTGQQRQAVQNKDSSQIQQTIQKDMEIWMTSKQWPLSCYSCNKDEPCLPGLSDFSFEEVRLEAIKANAGGTGMVYQQSLKELLNKCNQRKLELKGMSSSQLHQEIKSAELQSMSSKSSLLSRNSQAQSIGGTTQSGLLSGLGVFGANVRPPGGLFTATSTTTTAPPQGIFGKTSSSQQPMNTFGSVSQPASVFGNASTTKPVGGFGSVTNSPLLTSNTFGQNNQLKPGSLFGNSTPSIQPGGTLGHQTPQRVGILGTAPAAVSQVGLFASSSVVKQSEGTLTKTQNSAQPKSNMESGLVTATAPSQTGPSNSVGFTYSEEDLQAFRADSFVLGTIPECAPPPELC